MLLLCIAVGVLIFILLDDNPRIFSNTDNEPVSHDILFRIPLALLLPLLCPMPVMLAVDDDEDVVVFADEPDIVGW